MAFKDGTKSGGRKPGTPNRSTSARYAAMARVNEALAAIGEGSLSGMKLLKEVLNHKETPLDVKIQCAGLLVKQETPAANEQAYVALMPAMLPPDDTPSAQLAVWWALNHGFPEGEDPAWDAAVKTVLEMAATKKIPGSLS
jgi:hypothetical protein